MDVNLRDEPLTNTEILSTIYNDASFDYQKRIPEPTQAGLSEQLSAMTDYRPGWNEFVHALVNRIGSIIIRNMSWNNPLVEFKRASMEYGSTIEEVAVGLVKAHSYSADRDYLEKDIWGQEVPKVMSKFHSINREDFYKLTVNEKVLRRAFLNEAGGLNNFVTQLLQSPRTSNQWDEFLLTCRLLTEYDKNDGFYRINVPDVMSNASGEAESKTALRRIRAAADNLGFLSDKYNSAHMPSFARRDDLILLTTPEFNAAMDVEALAGAFNMDKLNPYGRIVPIPSDQLAIPGAQAILTTREFFVISDTLVENTSIQNPVGLHTNFFSHHQGIYSVSPFAPAIMFTTKGGTEQIHVSATVDSISDLTITDRDNDTVTGALTRGEMYLVSADAVTTPEDAAISAVSYSVSGMKSSRTRIDRNGILHIGQDDSAASIKITVKSVDSDTENPLTDSVTREFTKTLTGNVIPLFPTDAIPTGITVAGEPVPDFDPATTSYAVTSAEDVTVADIRVTGVPDYTVTEGDPGVFTVRALSGAADRVYTVTVTGAV